jgi:hypothetical protein
MTLQFIKTLDSWLFHRTKFFTLEYNVKKSRDKITIHYITFFYTIKNLHNNVDMEIVAEVYTSLFYWKKIH